MRKRRVLIVDDSRDYLESLKNILEIMNFKVDCCFGGWEAYRLYLAQGFDLIISDVRMAEGDGIELLLKVKEDNPNRPPVILMTGYTVKEFEELSKIGAHAILRKPFRFDDLDAAVDSAINE